jgi:cell wall-associated NlpC family hydrolase
VADSGNDAKRKPCRARGRAALLVAPSLAAALALLLTVTPGAPARAASLGSQLPSGATLASGSSLVSPGGAFQLVMQPTGNLVEASPVGPLWATDTSSPGAYLVNQPTGNLVLVSAVGQILWSSGTAGAGASTLIIQDDGNVVDYEGSVDIPIWATGTSTQPAPPTKPGKPTPPTQPAPSVTANAIAFARKQIGKPYLYGGAGPASYDCSGLVMASYSAAGLAIPRTSQQQWKLGQPVAASARQPGDLVFYNSATAPTHVAMYLGNNQIIESLKPGTVVRIDTVTYPGNPVGYRRYG